MISLEVVMLIEHLAKQGKSARAIAREVGLHRKTVKKYLAGEEPGYHRTAPYPSILEEHRCYVEQRLQEFPELTADRIYRELKSQGYPGSYRQVARVVHCLRPNTPQQAFLRYETKPGECAQMDWGEFGRVQHYGRDCKLYAFALVLGYSRAVYVEFTVDTSRFTLMRCHERAFEYLGGVPQKILYDNLKTVVKWHLRDSESSTKEIHFNEDFLRFARHYCFLPQACAPYAPHEKGKVENTIGYLRSSFFVGREAQGLKDWNLEARTWLDTIANLRVHGTTREVPFERLQRERSALLALPGPAYDTAVLERRQVHKDCTFSFGGNYYSAPHTLVGQRITLRADETHLKILADGKVLAVHSLCPYRGKRIIDPSHYEGIARPRGSALSRYLVLFERWGQAGEAFVRGLIASRPADPYYHLGKVATLAADYATNTGIEVFTRCLQYQAFEFQTVKRLLLEKAAGEGQAESAPASVQSVQAWAQAEDVQRRPLSVYDAVTHTQPFDFAQGKPPRATSSSEPAVPEVRA